jgi:putative copper resistance protein D
MLLRRRAKAAAWPRAYADARCFSAMSLVAVAVIAASGMVNSYFLVGSFQALVTTGYGRVLAVKLCLFVATAMLGGRNLFVHEPRMESDPGALQAMRRAVWIEIALGASIVVAVAILGTLAPGSAPTGG